MLTRCWLPPDSRPTSSSARSSSPVWASIRPHGLFGIGELLEPREQPQVLGHRQLRVERRLLRHPADLAGRAVSISPSVGGRTPGEDREQRRLAGAVRADDRDQLAGLELEADRVRARSASRSAWSRRGPPASGPVPGVGASSTTELEAELASARRPHPRLERRTARAAERIVETRPRPALRTLARVETAAPTRPPGSRPPRLEHEVAAQVDARSGGSRPRSAARPARRRSRTADSRSAAPG